MISIAPFGELISTTDSPSPVNSSEESSYPGAEMFDDLESSLLDDNNEEVPQRKPRSRGATTAERRATHNAVERARRETLNCRFMDLAAALPNMANVKRPSKSAIVNKSIDYVRASQAREAALMAQNEALRIEVNEMRARLGMGPTASAPAPVAIPLPPMPASVPSRDRQLSIGSSSVKTESSASPLLSGGAASPNSAFDLSASPLQTAQAQLNGFQQPNVLATNPVNLMKSFSTSPAGSERKLSFCGDEGIHPQALNVKATVPPSMPSTPAFNSGAFTPLDLGYLMGLSVQHQAAQAQAQAALHPGAFTVNMQTGTGFAGLPAWQTSFPSSLPVSAGGNDAMTWLFA